MHHDLADQIASHLHGIHREFRSTQPPQPKF